jgi:hypothetical protein
VRFGYPKPPRKPLARPPLKLHHIDMRAVNGVAKTFETIDARRDDRQAVHCQSPLIRCPNHSRTRLNRGAGRYIALEFRRLAQTVHHSSADFGYVEESNRRDVKEGNLPVI